MGPSPRQRHRETRRHPKAAIEMCSKQWDLGYQDLLELSQLPTLFRIVDYTYLKLCTLYKLLFGLQMKSTIKECGDCWLGMNLARFAARSTDAPSSFSKSPRHTHVIVRHFQIPNPRPSVLIPALYGFKIPSRPPPPPWLKVLLRSPPPPSCAVL